MKNVIGFLRQKGVLNEMGLALFMMMSTLIGGLWIGEMSHGGFVQRISSPEWLFVSSPVLIFPIVAGITLSIRALIGKQDSV